MMASHLEIASSADVRRYLRRSREMATLADRFNSHMASPPVSGYLAWYDASQISGVANGASLASWSDLSGGGYTLTQGTGADQPIFYKTTGAKLVNGLPAVWFDGTVPEYMTNASISSASTAATGFVVANVTATGASGAYLFDSTTTAHRWTLGFGVISASHLGAYSGAGSGWPNSSGTYTPPTGVHVWTGVFGGSGGAVYVDGVSVGTGNSGTNPLAGLTVANNYTPSAANGMSGPICEIVLYPTALSGANITSVCNYLIAKWMTAQKNSAFFGLM